MGEAAELALDIEMGICDEDGIPFDYIGFSDPTPPDDIDEDLLDDFETDEDDLDDFEDNLDDEDEDDYYENEDDLETLDEDLEDDEDEDAF